MRSDSTNPRGTGSRFGEDEQFESKDYKHMHEFDCHLVKGENTIDNDMYICIYAMYIISEI